MALLADITLGRYVPGDSPLHRLDPRLKLVGLPLLIICVFSGTGGMHLAGMALPALCLILCARLPAGLLWRGVWILRWLFVFTVLLHLCFSPGRTLWGVEWLSLDGLLHGLGVCGQLALAVVFSSLLTLTTSPEELAAAFGALLRPLAPLGVRGAELAQLLLLILAFIPILRDEAVRIHAERAACGLATQGRTLSDRAKNAGALLAPLVLKVADRAEALAVRMARGESVVAAPTALVPLWRIAWGNYLFVFAVLGWLVTLMGIVR